MQKVTDVNPEVSNHLSNYFTNFKTDPIIAYRTLCGWSF